MRIVNEIWKPVRLPTVNGRKVSKLNQAEIARRYEISNEGNIRLKQYKVMPKLKNGKRKARRIKSKTRRTFLNGNGYEYVNLCIKNKKFSVSIHRLVANTFCEIPVNKDYKKCVINHKNGNKLDNNHTNLEFCSQSENMIHAMENGLCSFGGYGEDHMSCKVSNNTVYEILDLYHKEGLTNKEIDELLGLTKGYTSKIVNEASRLKQIQKWYELNPAVLKEVA